MKTLWALAALIVLADGCASINPVPFNGPNGRQAYSMQCSGMGRTSEACYQMAGKLCPQGYSIVDSRSDIIGVPSGHGGMMIAPKRSLAVECR